MKLDQGEMEWRQPEARHRFYELARGGETVASLRFAKAGGSLATGQCGESKWTFKRAGFLAPRVLIREAGSDVEIAIFAPRWTGSGWLAFNSGRRYHLRQTNFWGTEWAFEAEDGSPLVILSGPHGLCKQGGHLRVLEQAAGVTETPIMLVLIWYLRILMHEDASAAAVIAACS